MSRVPAAGFDGADAQPITHRVINVIANKNGVDPLEFDHPLYDAVDADALDALLTHSDAIEHVEFVYEGCRVRVNGAGDVVIRDPNGG